MALDIPSHGGMANIEGSPGDPALQPSALVVSQLGMYRVRIRGSRKRHYLAIAGLGIGVAWLFAAIIYYYGLAIPLAFPLAVACTILFPAAALFLESARKPTLPDTAALIDRRLDNSQRLVTSVELMSRSDKEPQPGRLHGTMAEAQIKTSADMLSRLEPKTVYPAQTPWNLAAAGVGLLLVAASFVMLKGIGFAPLGVGALPPDQPVAAALAAPTPDGGLPPSELTPEPTPTPKPDELALGGGSQQQQDGAGSEQGNSSDQPTSTPKEQAAASQQAESSLSRLQRALDGQSVTQQAADALKQGNTDQAAQQIADVGKQSDQVSDAAKKGLADALDQAAQDTGADPVLQQAEKEAADSLRKGDYNSVSAGLKDLSDALKQTAANVVPQQQLAQSFPEQPSPQTSGDQKAGTPTDPQTSSQNTQSTQSNSDGSEQGDGNQSTQGDQSQNSSQGSQGGTGDTSQQPGDGSGQQPGQGGGSKPESGQGDSQGGAPGEGTRVNGPKDTTKLDVPGNPFELQAQPDTGNTKPSTDPQEHPGLTLDGGAGGSGASPVIPGQAINVPGETGSVPLDRWDIIRKFFSPGQ